MTHEWNVADIIASLSLIVSVIVLVVLIIHARIFNKQADALAISVQDSKSKEARELRAYLFPTGECKIIRNSLSGTGWDARDLDFEAEFINSGRTPATQIEYTYSVDIFLLSHFCKVDVVQAIKRIPQSLPDIGPGQAIKILGEGLTTQTDYLELMNYDGWEEKNLYFYGSVKYQDLWGNPHKTNFYFLMIRNHDTEKCRMQWSAPDLRYNG